MLLGTLENEMLAAIVLFVYVFINNILLEISVWILLQNKYYNYLQVNNQYLVALCQTVVTQWEI